MRLLLQYPVVCQCLGQLPMARFNDPYLHNTYLISPPCYVDKPSGRAWLVCCALLLENINGSTVATMAQLHPFPGTWGFLE